jgi:hypothetical protein
VRAVGPLGAWCAPCQRSDEKETGARSAARHVFRFALFPIKQGESVVICFTPTKAVTWDYAVGETREPH